MTIQSIKKQVVPTLKRAGAIKIAIFGSYARGDFNKTSDIDILVKFKGGITLLKLSGIKIDLEEKSGKKVDLITYGGINPRLKTAILKEQKVIYEKRS